MRALAIAVLLMIPGGCTTAHDVFPEAAPPEVWTALVAVAKTPKYDAPEPEARWTVRENDVWVDEASRRIEIYRELDRVLHRPGTKPIRQQKRTWRFQILFEDQYPPSVRFVSRGLGVPMHARLEADRYFADVHAFVSPANRSDISTGSEAASPDAAYIEVDAHKSSER